MQCLKPRLATQPSTVATVTTATERVRGSAWMRIRARVLRAEPRCVLCLAAGRLAAAVEVDHRMPLARGGTDDDTNLQGLCRRCHKEKTDAEQRV